MLRIMLLERWPPSWVAGDVISKGADNLLTCDMHSTEECILAKLIRYQLLVGWRAIVLHALPQLTGVVNPRCC
jgi:hypothetical protein